MRMPRRSTSDATSRASLAMRASRLGSISAGSSRGQSSSLGAANVLVLVAEYLPVTATAKWPLDRGESRSSGQLRTAS